jgi:hypothetical protein
MEFVHIYAKPSIRWHVLYANALRAGFAARGFTRVEVRSSPLKAARYPEAGVLPVVLGPNNWHAVQAACRDSGGAYLMLNRAFWGDPDYVTIGWNGFNGHADYLLDYADLDRYAATGGPEIRPARAFDVDGEALILGQYNLHSHDFTSLAAWQHDTAAALRDHYPRLTVRVRSHPAVAHPARTLRADLRGCTLACTLNSTAVVESIAEGVPVLAADVGSVAYGWAPKSPLLAGSPTKDRLTLLRTLAWAQWSLVEIREGLFLDHLLRRTPHVKPMPIFYH